MKKAALSLLLIALWLVLPTGDPSDVLITLPLIGALGLGHYLLLAGGLVLLYICYRGR